MEGSLGRKFNGSKGTEPWGILGTGAGVGRSGEIRLAKGLYAEGKGKPLKGLSSGGMMCLDGSVREIPIAACGEWMVGVQEVRRVKSERCLGANMGRPWWWLGYRGRERGRSPELVRWVVVGPSTCKSRSRFGGRI